MLVDVWRHLDAYLDSWNVSDALAEQHLAEARERLERFGDRAEFCQMESGDAAAHVPDDYLDFVYIDANHSYDAVKRDLVLWYPKVRSGGLVSGHDYFDARADADLEPDLSTIGETIPVGELTSYGVKSAVDGFARERQYDVQWTREELPSWFFLKR
jgi:Methyltransferase domain